MADVNDSREQNKSRVGTESTSEEVVNSEQKKEEETREKKKKQKQKMEDDILKELRRSGVYIPPFKQRRVLEALKKANSGQVKMDENKTYQRLKWDALRKKVNSTVNKLSRHNLSAMVVELIMHCNCIRGRGLLCRALLKAQNTTSVDYTPVYVAFLNVLNSRVPLIGELYCIRSILAFRRAFERSDRSALIRITENLSYLTNFRILSDLVILQIITLLIKQSSNDCLVIAQRAICICGAKLKDSVPKAMQGIFEQIRLILSDDRGRSLHSSFVDKKQNRERITVKTQYELERVMDAYRNGFAEYPRIPHSDDLDLIDDADVITHKLSLTQEMDSEQMLDVFQFDPEWTKHENRWKRIRCEIVGTDAAMEDLDDSSDEEEEGSDDENEEDSTIVMKSEGMRVTHDRSDADDSSAVVNAEDDNDEGHGPNDDGGDSMPELSAINTFETLDMTNSDVTNLRREIYLTFMSSLTEEEMAHKILKKFGGEKASMEVSVQKADGSTHKVRVNVEKQVARMILEACAHERGYRSQYASLASRLCKVTSVGAEKQWHRKQAKQRSSQVNSGHLSRMDQIRDRVSKMGVYEDCFDELFIRQYNELHLYDSNKIRNVGRFFAYLLVTDALDWSVLEFVKLTQSDTNPSKRIFIKVLFQELASFLGSEDLKQRLFGSSVSEEVKQSLKGLFPDQNPKHMRFAINFFTTIGLGNLTDGMRATLKEFQMKLRKQQEMMDDSSDSDDSSSDDDSDSSSSTDDSSDSSDSSSSSLDSDSSDSESSSRNRSPSNMKRNVHPERAARMMSGKDRSPPLKYRPVRSPNESRRGRSDFRSSLRHHQRRDSNERSRHESRRLRSRTRSRSRTEDRQRRGHYYGRNGRKDDSDVDNRRRRMQRSVSPPRSRRVSRFDDRWNDERGGIHSPSLPALERSSIARHSRLN